MDANPARRAPHARAQERFAGGAHDRPRRV